MRDGFFKPILWTVLCLMLLGSGLALARSESPDKVAVVDGRFVHRVGELWHHVTNWGMVGSAPSVPTTFSDAPSAMWPGGSGEEYLWAAGIWVGGTVLGEQLVTTGSFRPEFLPTDAPGDTIHTTFNGAPGGARYPWPGADDDGDGLEDEDILNGLDDDDDGLIDEDFAAMSDQHFLCSYTDFEADILENHPDHTPLNLHISQQSMQWSHPLYDDFVGYEFTITNVGVIAIQDVYLGMFSDFDIGPRGQTGIESDDYAGFVSEVVQLSDGSSYPLNISYMYDNPNGSYNVDGYAGWALLGHPTDPTGQTAPMVIGVRSFQHYSGQVPFGQGGDPTNDQERYHSLSMDQWDPDVPNGLARDYRTLMSSGPFLSLEPGESISFQVALVVGAGLEEMKAHATAALETYRGRDYDRDGDPTNGAEFTVHWICPADDVVATQSDHLLDQEDVDVPVQPALQLSASPNPFNPQVNLSLVVPDAQRALLQVFDLRGRLVTTLWDGPFIAAAGTISWNGKDRHGRSQPSGVYEVRLVSETGVLNERITLLR